MTPYSLPSSMPRARGAGRVGEVEVERAVLQRERERPELDRDADRLGLVEAELGDERRVLLVEPALRVESEGELEVQARGHAEDLGEAVGVHEELVVQGGAREGDRHRAQHGRDRQRGPELERVARVAEAQHVRAVHGDVVDQVLDIHRRVGYELRGERVLQRIHRGADLVARHIPQLGERQLLERGADDLAGEWHLEVRRRLVQLGSKVAVGPGGERAQPGAELAGGIRHVAFIQQAGNRRAEHLAAGEPRRLAQAEHEVRRHQRIRIAWRVVEAEQVSRLVLEQREQIEAADRVGRSGIDGERARVEAPGELAVVGRRRIDEPALAGGVRVDVDRAADDLAQHAVGQIGEHQLRRIERRRVGIGRQPEAPAPDGLGVQRCDVHERSALAAERIRFAVAQAAADVVALEDEVAQLREQPAG